MFTYCLKCKKYEEPFDLKVLKTKKGRPVLSSKYAVWDSKQSKFMKKQEAKGLLSCLDLKTPLIKVPLLVEVLF